jgi:hypothetical protein
MGRNSRGGGEASLSRVYTDVCSTRPPEYSDYEALNVQWGSQDNYSVVRKVWRIWVGFDLFVPARHLANRVGKTCKAFSPSKQYLLAFDGFSQVGRGKYSEVRGLVELRTARV